MYAYSFNAHSLKKYFSNYSVSNEHIELLINLIYRSPHKNIDNFTQIPPLVRQHFKRLDQSLPKIVKKETALDKTTKFLIELSDKSTIEMVLLPFYKKFTLCVSSQVGCAMGCEFCFTAKQGFKRNLEAYEIIAQILLAKSYLKEQKDEKRDLTNIVFMGQGEPLHNFDNLKESIDIITMRNGISISEKNITVSTVGYIPGLKRYNELNGINIALSLHSAIDVKRNKVIPLNQRFKLNEIIELIDTFKLNKKQTIEYEYLLIKDFNEEEEDAQALFELLKERTHMINIIPFNPFPGTSFEKPDRDSVYRFKQMLVKRGLMAMVRTTKGDDILAACGQLNSKKDEINEHLY